MKIKNLTDVTQEISFKEHAGGEEFTLYIEPQGSTEVEGAAIINEAQLISEHLISLDSPEVAPVIEEAPVVATQVEAPVVETTEEKDEEETCSSKQFICDECGAEFASARGLTSHKAKAHC